MLNSIKLIIYLLSFTQIDAFKNELQVFMLLETSDPSHAKELEKKLLKDYPHSQIISA